MGLTEKKFNLLILKSFIIVVLRQCNIIILLYKYKTYSYLNTNKYFIIIVHQCFFFSTDRKSEGKHSPMKINEQFHRDMEVEEFEYSHQV